MHKIIIIENTSLLRRRITNILKQNGYDNIVGFSSADHIGDNPELFLKDADLIITNIGLPGIGGIQLAKILSKYTSYCNIPIMFISSYSDTNTVREAIRAGAVDYILKPFEDQLLVERVNKLLSDTTLNIISSIDSQIDCSEDELKTIISMEYERASRGKHPLSFIKLKVDSENIKSAIEQIKNKIRKIDTVYKVDDVLIATLPLTGESGVEVVFEKFFYELFDNNISIIQKDLITFNPDSPKTMDELYKALFENTKIEVKE